MSEIVHGWNNCAAIAGIPVRSLRDLASERKLLRERRADGAIGISRIALEALAVEMGKLGAKKNAATNTVLRVVAVDAEVAPEALAPVAVEAIVNESDSALTEVAPDDVFSISDLQARVSTLEGALAMAVLQIESARTLANENADTIDAAFQREEFRLGELDLTNGLQRRLMEMLEGRASAAERQVAGLEQRIGGLEALLRSMPMAPRSTGESCPRCGQQALVTPVACACCGLGTRQPVV